MQSKSPTPTSSPISSDPSLAGVLEAISLAMLGVFLATVVVRAWPLKILDSQWQLGFAAELISNASLALMGALLTPLALAFHSGSDRLRARRNAFRRLALAAAIGFLLLIPLQAFAGWRLYRTVTSTAEQQTSQSARKLTELRQAIATATSPQEIQAKLNQLAGPNAGLTPTQLRTPINQLRQELLVGADQAANRLQQRIQAQASFKPDRLVKETTRIALSSLFYAAGFAFLSGALPRSNQRSVAFGWRSGKEKF
ncbi:HpsJ family protein [Vulcanococcus limneticus]|uniref:HpsJ family protein n=1 Tax=Vulcanococcus limneticus TaxID=2170428 RepID=UPI00350D25AE